jgi:nanoRNase/pAp phosphatase (c-di-AMP/oligoRNAs hydrolase)
VFVNSLDVDLDSCDDVDMDSYDAIAMVDCSIPGENNGLRSDGDVGAAGGHDHVAAAEIPLGLFADARGSSTEEDLIDIAADLIGRRFFEYAGYEDGDI